MSTTFWAIGHFANAGVFYSSGDRLWTADETQAQPFETRDAAQQFIEQRNIIQGIPVLASATPVKAQSFGYADL